MIWSKVALTFYFAAKPTNFMRTFALLLNAEYRFLSLLYALQPQKYRLIILSFQELENFKYKAWVVCIVQLKSNLFFEVEIKI